MRDPKKLKDQSHRSTQFNAVCRNQANWDWGSSVCGGFHFINFDMFTTSLVLKQWSIITITWSWTTHVALLYCFVVNLITHP